MVIDARELDEKEAYLRLKEIFGSAITAVSMEVLVKDRRMAGKVAAFCKMSGFKTQVRGRGDHYSVLVTGYSCRCG